MPILEVHSPADMIVALEGPQPIRVYPAIPSEINVYLFDTVAYKGEDGKSCYEYAVEGGYKGTEAEFTACMNKWLNEVCQADPVFTPHSAYFGFSTAETISDATIGTLTHDPANTLAAREWPVTNSQSPTPLYAHIVVQATVASYINTVGIKGGLPGIWGQAPVSIGGQPYIDIRSPYKFADASLTLVTTSKSGSISAMTWVTTNGQTILAHIANNAIHMTPSDRVNLDKLDQTLSNFEPKRGADDFYLSADEKNGGLRTGNATLTTVKKVADKVDDIIETIRTRNIFDISKISIGLLNTVDGQLITTFVNRRTSDYMAVLPLTFYYLSINASPYAPSRCCVYTAAKVFIRSQAITDPTPSNAGYMRISTYDIADNSVIALMQVESGSVTSFIPYSVDQFSSKYMPDELDKVRIILPDNYYLAVGDTFQLFWKSIVESPLTSQYYIQARCTKGLSLPRYYEFTPAISDVGDTVLTIDVRDSSYNLLATQQTTLRVKNAITQPSVLKQVCCVGDSLTDGDDKWHNEFFRRLKNTNSVTSQGDTAPTGKGYSNISGIGTRGTVNFNEGHSGWNWDSYTTANSASGNYFITVINYAGKDPVSDQHAIYKDANNKQWKLETIAQTSIKILPVIAGGTLPSSGTLIWVSGGASTTNISYSAAVAEAGNPFWNVSLNRLDFTGYYNNLVLSGMASAVGSLDVMYIFLTWNFGVSYVNAYTKDFWTIEVTKIKTFIDRLHADFPLCKVKLMSMPHPSYNGGCGYSYGAKGGYSEWYGMLRAINGQSLAYMDLSAQSGYSSFIEYIHTSGQVDSEYNMQWSNFKVNARNTLILRRDTNGIHPAKEGYYQIADAAYRNFIANYCQ